MKKSLFALAASLLGLSSTAQDNTGNARPWVAELNVQAGLSHQNMTMFNMAEFYPMAVNGDVSDLNYTRGAAYGFNGQLGYFFGNKRKWGIGTGLVLFANSGNIEMNKFHMEYRAADFKNDVYRQLITATAPINEEVKFNSLSVPVVAKFRHDFAKKWVFTADAGMVYNVYNKYTGTSSASFDYEAVYKFVQAGATPTAVYDPTPTPGPDNWLITKTHYTDKNPEGNMEAYFNSRAAEGYNVGLDKKSSQSQTMSYKSGALGFVLQPAIGLMLNDNVALNLGLSFMSQTFKNDRDADYRLVDNEGNLNTLSGGIEKNTVTFFGCNFGLRFHFGK